MVYNRETYLEGSHRKGVNITRSRRTIDPQRGLEIQETFWGHISNGFRRMVVVQKTSKRACDPKVAETRLAFPSNQDVALEAQASTCEINRFFVCLPE
jgi:hypothetical protein